MFSFLRRYLSKDGYHYRFIRRTLGVTPTDIELYKLALVHRSASVVLESGEVMNNERLEFLGDAVLQVVVSELLFVEYPLLHEGSLTQLRSKMVSRESLNALSQKIGLHNEICYHPTAMSQGKINMYGDAFEAMVGALYIDKGYNRASKALVRLLTKQMDIEQMLETERDFKSRIVEWSQRERQRIEWKTVQRNDPQEREQNFETILIVNGEPAGFGVGHSKKQSEQRASKQCYEKIVVSG